ncbi:hypothetical protein pb186bvf_020322 [Paramecium bursaria]
MPIFNLFVKILFQAFQIHFEIRLKQQFFIIKFYKLSYLKASYLHLKKKKQYILLWFGRILDSILKKINHGYNIYYSCLFTRIKFDFSNKKMSKQFIQACPNRLEAQKLLELQIILEEKEDLKVIHAQLRDQLVNLQSLIKFLQMFEKDYMPNYRRSPFYAKHSGSSKDLKFKKDQQFNQNQIYEILKEVLRDISIYQKQFKESLEKMHKKFKFIDDDIDLFNIAAKQLPIQEIEQSQLDFLQKCGDVYLPDDIYESEKSERRVQVYRRDPVKRGKKNKLSRGKIKQAIIAQKKKLFRRLQQVFYIKIKEEQKTSKMNIQFIKIHKYQNPQKNQHIFFYFRTIPHQLIQSFIVEQLVQPKRLGEMVQKQAKIPQTFREQDKQDISWQQQQLLL